MKHPAIPLLLPLALAAASCTTNNGDIGPIMGQWQLTRIESSDPAEYPATLPAGGTVYWGFQSSTIHMSWITDTHVQDNRFGNYRLTDDTLFLDFPDEGTQFRPLLGLPDQCELQLIELTSKRLTVMYEPQGEYQITYYFRKW